MALIPMHKLHIWAGLAQSYNFKKLKSLVFDSKQYHIASFINVNRMQYSTVKKVQEIHDRVSHGKVNKVICLCWGYRFWFLLIFWILRVFGTHFRQRKKLPVLSDFKPPLSHCQICVRIVRTFRCIDGAANGVDPSRPLSRLPSLSFPSLSHSYKIGTK